ncbi:MAG: acetyl-CoA carboxylase biotin carboxylase subunit [marine benthic group bacterium]|jgi:acetyl-CoA carboxylase biotin carboxylase subunit|nr:acetyl-CoA carboxylase biotin carboxylase subunit [Gemmatimonadota bacterium]
MLEKVLVANRGEIALRIVRACQELGVSAVAVYSEPDEFSPHVLTAEEAIPIGPAPAGESYLDIDRLLDAARRSNAQAIHPGYGFLAENPEFARRVEEDGFLFIGPSAAAIGAMGDKTEARRRMLSAGVPVVPGSEGPIETDDQARAEAARIGFPILLKAAAGGGGKGMRVVEEASELPRAFEAATREADQAFGDPRVYMERFLARPRHIEIQVLADAHGHTIHLGERECSIQRRHQKLIEEAPSPAVNADLRAEMGKVAVAAAEAVDYVGAGTVEFLVEDGQFFFLEMNTRIQVEHPVTELVTGVDLVQWQIRIAAGARLEVEADPDWPAGHSIECRISGEDPFAGFFPSTGRIESLYVPTGPGVRWDGGIARGFEVGLHYDPLLAKLVVHAPSREEAIMRMRRALRELQIEGIRTTQPFHLAVMDEPDFRAGEFSIQYIDEHPELLADGAASWQERAAAIAAVLLEEERRERGGVSSGSPADPGPPPAREGRTAWQRAFDPR